MITENLSTLKIHKLTQEQYDRELASGNIDENALYLTPDVVTDVDELIDMMNEYKEETNTALSGKSDTTHTHDNYEEVGVAATKANEALESAKSYTDQEIADLVNAVPETLDTLGELATAMKENQDVIDVLNNAITLKANKEEITNEINSINENIENRLEDAIENIEIGGRNLILNTSTDFIVDATNETHNFTNAIAYNLLEKGETYTFSAEVTVEGTIDQRVSILAYNYTSSTAGAECRMIANGTRQSCTFTVTGDTPLLLLYAGVAGLTTGIKATYHHMKLEKGNKATDWTPAPEDIDNAIEDVQIGGRNYILPNKLYSYTPYNTTPIYDGNVITTTFNPHSEVQLFTLAVEGFDPSAGMYTLSGYIKVNGEILSENFIVDSASTYGKPIPTRSKYNSNTGYFEITQYYNANCWIIHAKTKHTIGAAEIITFEKLKFEEGTRATDWTPALEDMVTIDEEVINSASDVAKIVPEGSGKYAAINKVGGMSYKSRNLYENKQTTKTVNGITYTVNSDGSVTANGTATATAQLNLGTTRLPKGNYKVSGYDGSIYGVELYTKASNDSAYPVVREDTDLICTEDVDIFFICHVASGYTVNNLTFKPMIRLATETNTSYEPYYSGLRNAYVSKIKSESKNLLTSAINGTFTAHTDFINVNLSSGTYTLSLNISSSGTDNYESLLLLVTESGGSQSYNISRSATLSRQTLTFTVTEKIVQIRILAERSYNNSYGDTLVISKAQIERGTEATEYEPYKENIFTIPTGTRGVGYGMGINEDCYNYIDFERKVYIQNVATVDLSTLDWFLMESYYWQTDSLKGLIKPAKDNYTIPNILAEKYNNAIWQWGGTGKNCVAASRNGAVACENSSTTEKPTGYFIYELETPIETDISDFIQDNSIEVQSGGIITLVNEYNYTVPNEISFYTSENPKKVIVADKFVGDFKGVKVEEIYTPYGSYKPYYSAGDSIDIDTAVAGLIANNKQEVWFTISLPKPIIGNPTITVTSINGLIVRQADKYCYTTSGSLTSVKPNSYNINLINKNISSLYIGAVMGNTTNVTTDDDACWVNANIKVTFS